MRKTVINLYGFDIPVYSLNTAVLGSGAAGLNCAVHLHMNGIKNIAIITEDIRAGTSRNAGSDKQTYYKLSIAGKAADSPHELAKTLFSGGAMDGDIALVEANLSVKEFFHLVQLGVPFPHDRFGAYVGYKTDYDPKQRGTSAGPETSRYMHNCLLKEAESRGIEIFDGYVAISLFRHGRSVVGLMCLDSRGVRNNNFGMTLFNCTNVVLATGGPAALYKTSVYPESQSGSTGLAFEIGARGKNLTEWQYGIASVKFRWNLSGTYQQVIPRYISTDAMGKDEKEFLHQFFPSVGKMATCIFMKGYEWPFDARKIVNYGSSLIDLLVYRETVKLGRKVFIDFRQNLTGFRFEDLEKEAYDYLEKSDALFGTPIERLEKMNPLAVKIYADHGIDLKKEPLEIAVCAQHNNGGLAGNIWWESNVKHLFPIGEVNGSHGVYRPGGSALNSGQVGGYRAAQFIAAHYRQKPRPLDQFIMMIKPTLKRKIKLLTRIASKIEPNSKVVSQIKSEIQDRMTMHAAHIRSPEGIRSALDEAHKLRREIEGRLVLSSREEIISALKIIELSITHVVYLEAFRAYLERGGGSRGSYVILDKSGVSPLDTLENDFRFKQYDESLMDEICEVWFDRKAKLHVEWRKVRPIPTEENWFEKVWENYRSKKVIR